ncbi:MAG: hypothetical protein PW789_10855 [Edaphobacter sp.]|uniref:hypothetical protein n=1 Tax=Edaphobacter sp. TaxID=1934404 RepID=UPI0023A6A02A|nr:hypothetical protein [Edaphobacter sp.]MDE1177089.1 hypothetical protein [Edaphobacter sp.]
MRSLLLACTFLSLSLPFSLIANAQQKQDPRAQAMAKTAVETELAADKADHTRWRYRSDITRPEGHFLYIVVETDKGSVKKKIEENGKPLDGGALNSEMKRIDSFVHDPSQQEKQRKDSSQDDARAEKMLRMLPDAFLWSIKSDSPTVTTLAFTPDPNFSAPSMEARVFAAMAGEIVVTKPGHRMQSLKGHLLYDVKFGFGILGKMEKDGTFNIERRQIGPGVWTITESHIHFNGHVLFFKTISEQEDEVKTDLRQMPNGTTLEQAANTLRPEPTSLNASR